MVCLSTRSAFLYICFVGLIQYYNSLLLGSVRKYQVEKSTEEKRNAVESESMSFTHLSIFSPQNVAPFEVFAKFFISNHFVKQLDRVSAMIFVSVKELVLL